VKVNVRFSVVKPRLSVVNVVVSDNQLPSYTAARRRRRRRGRLTAWRHLVSTTDNCRRTSALRVRRDVRVTAAV